MNSRLHPQDAAGVYIGLQRWNVCGVGRVKFRDGGIVKVEDNDPIIAEVEARQLRRDEDVIAVPEDGEGILNDCGAERVVGFEDGEFAGSVWRMEFGLGSNRAVTRAKGVIDDITRQVAEIVEWQTDDQARADHQPPAHWWRQLVKRADFRSR